MKGILNYQLPEVAQLFNDTPFWSSLFGAVLLKHIPLAPRQNILDIGFGTGFPLIELAQRVDSNSQVYGCDPWEQGITLTQQKIKSLELAKVTIFKGSAEQLPLNDNHIDLVSSNLSINNLEDPEVVLNEINRVLKPNHFFCLTTNDETTFQELYQIFYQVSEEQNLSDLKIKFKQQATNRKNTESLRSLFKDCNFEEIQLIKEENHFSFTSGEALFDHSLIRIGFLENWLTLIPTSVQKDFVDYCITKIDQHISNQGKFSINVPIFYFQLKNIKET